MSDDDFSGCESDDFIENENSLFDIILKESFDVHLVHDKGMVLCVDKNLDEVRVLMSVNTNHIPSQSALAWGINKDVSIEFYVEYGCKNNILIDIKPASKVAHQLRNIAKKFLNDADKKENRLTQFISYMWARIATLHMYCTICDDEHFDGICMINPTSCMKPLCMYSMQLCQKFLPDFDIGGGIRGGQIKLLRTFFIMSVMSDRYDKILSPWPVIYDKEQKVLIDRSTSIEEIRKTVQYFKSDMVACAKCGGESCIKCSLESWVLTSNRSSILSLQEYQRCGLFKTNDQYLLISNPPELEERFQDLKKEYGSQFFYHGSPTDNWHSILRNGFFVASGTDYQLHGAVHGVGVYVAHQMNTAAGYARFISKGLSKDYVVDEEFKMIFIAVCEVIKNYEVVKDHGWCKVIPEASFIVPRFLLGYKVIPRDLVIPDSLSVEVNKWCVDTMSSFK